MASYPRVDPSTIYPDALYVTASDSELKEEPKDVPEDQDCTKEQLDHQRKTFLIFTFMLLFLGSARSGISPVVNPISKFFPSDDKHLQIAGPAFIVTALGCSIVAFFLILKLSWRRKIHWMVAGSCGLWLSSLFVTIALAADQQWILHVFAGPVWGFTIVSFPVVAALNLKLWAPIGKKGKGTGLGYMGGSIGTVIFVLMYGGLIQALSDYGTSDGRSSHDLAVSFGTLTAIEFALSLVMMAFWYKNRTSLETPAPKNSPGGPKGGPAIGKIELSYVELLKCYQVWLLTIFYGLTTFVGYGSKALLSLQFEVVYGVSFFDSVLLCALALIPYGIIHSLAPIISDYPKINIIMMAMVLMAIDAILYGVLQTIIDAADNLWLFWLTRAITSYVHGSVMSLHLLLQVTLVGPRNALKTGAIVNVGVSVGSAVGVMTGYQISLTADGNPRDAFAPFYYICCGIMVAALVVLAILYVLVRKEQKAAGAKEKDAHHEGPEKGHLGPGHDQPDGAAPPPTPNTG